MRIDLLPEHERRYRIVLAERLARGGLDKSWGRPQRRPAAKSAPKPKPPGGGRAA